MLDEALLAGNVVLMPGGPALGIDGLVFAFGTLGSYQFDQADGAKVRGPGTDVQDVYAAPEGQIARGKAILAGVNDPRLVNCPALIAEALAERIKGGITEIGGFHGRDGVAELARVVCAVSAGWNGIRQIDRPDCLMARWT